MARSMVRRGRSRRPRRPVDWVTTFGGYNQQLGPVSMQNDSFDQWVLYAHGDIQNIGGDDWSYGLPQYDGIIERVRGHVECWVAPDTSWWSTLTGICRVKFRLEKCQAVVSGGTATFPPQTVSNPYTSAATLFTPVGGNIEFLWEENFLFIAEAQWGSITVDPSTYVQKADFDVRVKRKMEQNDMLVLTVSVIGRNYDGEYLEFPLVWVDWEARTLVSQKR